jgi:hypothetical protein
METGTIVSLGISVLLLLEKVLLKTKKCKSKCCCVEIEKEMMSPKSAKQLDIENQV